MIVQSFSPISLDSARRISRVPTEKLVEWPTELRDTLSHPRPGFQTYVDQARLRCVAISPDSVTMYVWTCAWPTN